MPAKKKITINQYEDALRESFGNISMAARMLNVERSAVQYAIEKHPSVKNAHDEAAERITDIAEGHLVAAIERGDMRQVQYWLDNKARHRGYGVRRTEISGPDRQPIAFRFEDVIQELEQG